ncbi:MAG TPA: winged helix-turn-helix domain-containing protein [Acidimicrobiia bacterium]|jgi:DNA-binding transcriptional ArsR family regulator
MSTPTPADLFEIEDAETLEMLADPTRIELIERLMTPASVTEVAEAMGVARTRLYHHIRLLEEAGLIRVVGERRRRAVTEKVYQSAARRFQPSRRFLEEVSPAEAIAAIVDSAFAVTRVDITRSFAEGRAGFDHDDPARTTMLSRSVVRLSPERLRSLVDELEALLRRYEDDDAGESAIPVAFLTVVYPSSREQL